MNYVDYGNESIVDVSCLYVATDFEGVPILSSKFMISGIVASNKNGEWSSFVLKAVREQLTNALCFVHVENVGVPISTCSIKPQNITSDIFEWMIRNQMGYGIELSPSENQILYV